MRIVKKLKRSGKIPVVEVPASIGAIGQNSRLGRKAKTPVLKKRVAKKVVLEKVEKTRGKARPYVIVRCTDSSPFTGDLMSVTGRHVILLNARRCFEWEGAATLSELAENGTSTPEKCKWPAPVSRVELLDACEVLYSNATARATHNKVAVWGLNK